MAKVNGPLFSLGASGKLADTLVYGSWKGIKTARSYTKPANPRTTAQLAQRAVFSLCVDFWRGTVTDADMVEGWNRSALYASDPMSGFNLFMRNASKIGAIDTDHPMIEDVKTKTTSMIIFNLHAIDPATATATDYSAWKSFYGTNPAKLVEGPTPNPALISNEVDVDLSGLSLDAGTYYFKLTGDGYDLMGVTEVELSAP